MAQGKNTETPTTTQQEKFAVTAPSVSLPKGGGAIRGMGEKFAANPVTGTGSMSVPIATSPGRSGFGPQLTLSYDSGAGNGPFGFGWSLSLPQMTRKTDKGLPRYDDAAESDVFLLSGAEDLVPVLVETAPDVWEPEKVEPRDIDGHTYTIKRYRPRIEGLFARIERWTRDDGDVHWRSITRDNILTLYGKDANARIADPEDATRIFSWLICETRDDKGNAVLYKYKNEDGANVDLTQAHEANRGPADDKRRQTNRYIKHIRYGNRQTLLVAGKRLPFLTQDQIDGAGWMFEVVFDYGEHDTAAPKPDDAGAWPRRSDAFSTYRASFEVRTYRLCQRVLMFHHFEGEEGVGKDCLVRSTDFAYSDEVDPTDARNPVYTFLEAVTQTGYQRDGAGGYLSKSLPPVGFVYSEPIVQDTVEEVDLASLENLPVGLDGSGYRWTDLHGEGIPGILTEQAGAWFYKRNLSPINARPGHEPDGPDGLAHVARRPHVEAAFAPLETVALKPNLALGGGADFMDLAGDGQPDLVVMDGPVPGLYEHDEAEGWEAFRPFSARLNRATRDPNLKFVDLDGDGRADVLITENDAFVWHPSLGEQGFGPAHRVAQALNDEKGPRIVFAGGDPREVVYLADLSGDGLTDIVRIRSDDVCYWPNLGYGRFGAKVTMDNAPTFDRPDQFDQKRIRLADIDGSGTTDIIYLHRDGVRLYFNQSGNGWSLPQTLDVFPRIDDLASIVPTDLLGNGTACLVWSSALPGDARRPMRYVNLMGGQKPHLLVKTTNNLGAETRVEYAPSTRFYLQDKRDGKPWITRLPFPVHVVARVETWDHISRNRFVTTYAYHHGYFDGEEREFRGFGMVEQTDTEAFAVLTSTGAPPADNEDAASHVPPVLTRTWFHTGIYLGRDRVSNYFAGLVDGTDRGEYYRGPAWKDDDAQAARRLLPDTLLPAALSTDEEREAARTLKGSMLRQEVYALDGVGKSPEYPFGHPYTVAEQNFTVSKVQPRGDNQHAVFFTHPCEAITYHYERNAEDPRVQHALTLEVDAYGNVLRSLAVGYGRRASPLAEEWDRKRQTTTLISYSENVVTHPVGDPGDPNLALHPDDYRTPLPAETRTFELTGFVPPDDPGRFSFDEWERDDFLVLRSLVENPYEQDAAGQPRKRLVERVRTLYRSDNLSGFLAVGKVEPLALPGESYKLALTPGLLAQVFRRSHQPLLPNPGAVLGGTGGDQGGYVDLLDDGHWWIPSGRSFYHPDDVAAPVELAEARAHFFLPRRYRDPFGKEATVKFDGPADPVKPRYDLLVVETRDALGNRITVDANDYRVLQPRLVSDPNRNQTEVAFDTLGMLVGTAVMGKPTDDPRPGDTLAGFATTPSQDQLNSFMIAPRQPSANPNEGEAPPIVHTLLGSATTRIVYDLDRFSRTQKANPDDPKKWEPPFAATIARETHVSDLQPGQKSKLQISFSYSDGFGREIQKKIQAEPGPLLEGGPGTNPRWVGSGWTVFNNKGKPVRQYEPFFAGTHRFEFGVQVGVSPILFYDPAGRVVATLHPNHSYEKVVFDPWQQTSYDVNDTCAPPVQQPGEPPPRETGNPRTDPDIGGYMAEYFKKQPDGWQTWYEQRISGALGADERKAAERAAAHAGTPTTAHFDALGRPFLTVARNRVVCQDHPLDGKPDEYFRTRVELDIEGNQRNVFDERKLPDAAGLPLGAWEQRTVMKYAYDMLGNRIHQASMEAGSRWMLNDVTGKPIRAWDSRGFARRMTYDELRRPLDLYVTESGVERLAERTVYGEGQGDAGNHRTRVYQVLDGAGIVTSEEYDFKGNLLRSRRDLLPGYRDAVNWNQNPVPTETFPSSSTYDALNRPLTVTTPDGSIYRPAFNEASLLDKVEVNLQEAAAATPFVANIDYNAKGQRGLIAYANGARTEYKYDPLTFRLTNLRTTRPAGVNGPGALFASPTVVQDLRCTYDPAGNITRIEDAALRSAFHDGEIKPVCTYTYDAVYRLIEATGREHIGQTAHDFAPPPGASRRDFPFMGLRANPNDPEALRRYSELYTYDAAGNFAGVRHAAAGGSWTRTYDYEEASLLPDEAAKMSNRLTRTTVGNGVNHMESYSYKDAQGHDVHGCMTAINTMQMTWDFEDQLQRVDLGGGGTAYYVYDAAGQRVRKVIENQNGTLHEERVYLGGYEVYRRHSGAQAGLERTTLHVMDNRQRIALVETRNDVDDGTPKQLVRYQVSNHLGSASLELATDAALISYEEYHPYGTTAFQAVRSQAETAKRYRYTGKERDEESGLHYHGARYYAAWTGRWIACDPSGIDDGFNLYAYVANRPIGHVDPNGRANTPIHEDLTRLVALQYVESHTALRIGRATNVPDTEKQFESIDASLAGDPESINRDVHVLGSGTRQQKVDTTMASFARRDLRFSADPIRDAGIYLLHPIQDASYHGASFGRGMGHALTPESDLAVGDKSFAQFYQVVKDTEKGIELMQQKGIIDRSKQPDRRSKAQWAGIYQGLKSIESQYSVALGLLNVLGIGGRLVGPVSGLVGGVLGAAIGAIGGFFAALFSGKNVAKGAARAAESGFVLGQAALGVGLGTIAGLGMNVLKNELRNETADKQSAYLRERIQDVKEEMTKKTMPSKMDRLEGGVRP